MLRVGDEKADGRRLEDGCAQVVLTVQFSVERCWTRDDFLGLFF
ncbi:MAG: hypothetical protein NZM43_11640 [Saprospiraceae bacterium]|nr:hypothetical protein [Saprospiraceae bacterium]MDW8484961.1 hypothetical protein [Saprospiraceae bacterium]